MYDDSLREPWLRGIAFNPAAPSDVLIRLLDRAAGEAGLLMCEGRDLPDAVIDAALHHPDYVIRRALARNQYVDPARLAPPWRRTRRESSACGSPPAPVTSPDGSDRCRTTSS
ncbi:hypothetical protein [Streptomyces sp. NPDC059874]|uniref:hypothetical protein n=1 Tax=Streptomyces sp. NPDC059874 TaxID=3346983 RepID=UPI003652E1A5